MAARRGKSQAKRKTSGGFPGWAWMMLGVALTLLAIFLVPRYLKSDNGDGFFRPTPNPDAQPALVQDDVDSIAPDTAASNKPEPEKPKPIQFSFYEELSGKEVVMSDAELAASTRAEAEARARADRLAATQQAERDAEVPSEPTASPATPQPAQPSESAPVATATAPTSTTPPTAAAANNEAAPSARYLLQAGAFGASGDAEATKARIAMLGLTARVESAQVDGKTVYRVRMGPYGSASELADAKNKLSNGGLPAIAIKSN